MRFLKSFFGNNGKEPEISTYKEFWEWFEKNEKVFFNVIKQREHIETQFFNKISEKLDLLKKGFFFLAGMYDDDQAEIIFTADGNIKNFIFIEELVEKAPQLKRWRFTAFKQPTNIEHASIVMNEYHFNKENISFFPNDDATQPDKISITVIHNDFNSSNEKEITIGTCIFLETYLGEINFANTIDSLSIVGQENNTIKEDLIPIEKLKDYLIWREKEFIEKYDGFRHTAEKDNYSSFEGKLKNGNPFFAIFNTTLLDWDKKMSHPWILKITFNYDGSQTNGMPDESTYKLQNEIEDKIELDLKDHEGYLPVGRETGDNKRETYFACKDFRKPSKIIDSLKKEYQKDITFDYDIYKDKYWNSFDYYQV